MTEIVLTPTSQPIDMLSEMNPSTSEGLLSEVDAIEVRPTNLSTTPQSADWVNQTAVAPEVYDVADAASIEATETEAATIGKSSQTKWIAGTLAAIGVPAIFAAAGGGGSKSGASDHQVAQKNSTTAAPSQTPQKTPGQPVVTEPKSPPIAVPVQGNTPKDEAVVIPGKEPSKEPAVPVSEVKKPEAPPAVPVAEKDEVVAPTVETEQPEVNDTKAKPQLLTTKIVYQDGSVVSHTGSADHPFQTASLRYIEDLSGTAVIRENSMVRPKPASVFTTDSDGDGLIDAVDLHPNLWQVSDRDLRMFSTLAYATEGKVALQKAFDSKSSHSVEINSIKADLKGQVDISEYQKHWDVLDVTSKGEWIGSGLDYTIFGNGKKADGTYTNVVVAFRGTKAFQDATAGLKLAQGETPTQAKELNEIIGKLAQYNPEHIYSTGHSLGGYLAQYFATYTVQESQFKDEFVRSVLFNPAVLTVDNSSGTDLRIAKERTDQFTQTRITDDRFTNESGVTYKTNSYVINGEWLSDGGVPLTYTVGAAAAAGAVEAVKGAAKGGLWGAFFGTIATVVTGGAALPLIAVGAMTGSKIGATTGAIKGAGTVLTFDGLGEYKNTIYLNNTAATKSAWDKHTLANFYETSTEVQKYFSQGTRIDKAYGNPYLLDSDSDGFSDGIEAKLNSNGYSSWETPYATGTSVTNAEHRPILAVVQTEDAAGNIISVKGIEMHGTQQGKQLVYTPSDNETDFGTDGFDWSAFENQAPAQGISALQGTAGDDVLKGSSGSDYLWGGLGSDTIIGGAGRDTFVFTAWDIREGKADRLPDFNPNEDVLDLSGMRSLLNDNDRSLKWSDLLVNDAILFDSDRAYLHFNTTEQTLAYRAAGMDSSIVFAHFDNEQVVSLSGANFIG